MDVLEDINLRETLLLDVRTYLCAKGYCNQYHKRTHNRITNFNLHKLESKARDHINNIAKLAIDIIDTLKINSNNIDHKTDDSVKTKYKNVSSIQFVKESSTPTETINKINNNKPIETVFNEIDKLAHESSIKIISTGPTSAPGKPITHPIGYRMTYGDINYLGNNKAILYFDRGYKGKQIFTNSMYPLEQQPKHKDLVVVDDVVFTATCICNSDTQHKAMFPHYRVTCALGLTCPARLNTHERIIYAIDRKATVGLQMKASSMLIRFW